MGFSTEQHPGVVTEAPAATRGFVLNHAMLRVKDPAVSLAFYSRILGIRLLRKLDCPEMKFSLHFLHHVGEGEQPPEDVGEHPAWAFAQRGIPELTHNWGTETDPISDTTTAAPSPRALATSAFRCPAWTPPSPGSTRTRSATSSAPSRAR